MKNKVLESLAEVSKTLKNSKEAFDIECGAHIEKLLEEGNENQIWQYLVSNELWGGAGSIADQACINSKEQRRVLEKALLKLGQDQQKAGKVNIRTVSWISAFNKWQFL